MIARSSYLDRIRAYLDKPIVKVITGMRRVGKSTLLGQVREELLAQGVPAAQILSINKDLVAWDGVRTYLDLDRAIQDTLASQPAPATSWWTRSRRSKAGRRPSTRSSPRGWPMS
ncbi:AAA family ATPase [Mesoterricola sediminis]|uniref:AAA family ATPase n=1 Tax=Mesoterricola sediminis TaxID=2927980 RepID=UPI003744359D